jgi:hypothetical protein
METAKLTWDKAGLRWKRVYRGRVFYGQRGVKKSDRQAYGVAVQQFEDWKRETDHAADADKPNAAQYREAIRLREAMKNWLELERENAEQYDAEAEARRHSEVEVAARRYSAAENAVRWYSEAEHKHRADPHDAPYPGYTDEYNRLVKELARLNKDFSRTKPPRLDEPGRLPVNPLAFRSYAEQMLWGERLDALKKHQNWTGTTPDKSLSNQIDQFLTNKNQQAAAGQCSFGWSVVIRHQAEHFRRFVGDASVEAVNSAMMANYHAHLLAEVQAKKLTNTYAKELLRTSKAIVRWLWEQEAIENLPRNLNKLRIDADAPTIRTFTIEEAKTLIKNATDRQRLYVLLMLNTGGTGKDLSDLKPTEVDWSSGRIIRKRSKTRKQKSVPVVNYKLWGETFRLLKQYGTQKGERALLNSNGELLRCWEEKDGKVVDTNAVMKAWFRLTAKTNIKKPLKLLRKTSASLLATHPTYGQFASLFLGHSPQTTAEKHYVKPPQDLFDEAVVWLGHQLGIE